MGRGEDMAKPTITVSVKDTEEFKVLSKCVTDFLVDERIDQSVREEYYGKISQFILVESDVQ